MAGLFFQQYSKLSVPIPLANLKLWLKADAGITLNGSNVSAWADQSGNNNNASQSVAIRQPVFVANSQNGLPAIVFDGSDDFMITSAIELSGKVYTGYYVFKYIAPIANSDLLVFTTSNYTESGSIYFSNTGTKITPGYHGDIGYS